MSSEKHGQLPLTCAALNKELSLAEPGTEQLLLHTGRVLRGERALSFEPTLAWKLTRRASHCPDTQGPRVAVRGGPAHPSRRRRRAEAAWPVLAGGRPRGALDTSLGDRQGGSRPQCSCGERTPHRGAARSGPRACTDLWSETQLRDGRAGHSSTTAKVCAGCCCACATSSARVSVSGVTS